jgi:hypothetical protein
MWLEPLSHWLVLSALLAQLPAGPAPATPSPPELIATRHPVFAIPFRIDLPTDPARQPEEVQLYVSDDRGAHWQLYAKAPVAQRQFMFRAGADGECWFVIRTLDRSGQLRPETIGAPGLRVLVDTLRPTFKLTARRVESKQMSVHWEIEESHLKPNSLSIQYRALPNGPWQQVAIDRPDPAGTATPAVGDATFALKPGEGDIQIRGEVADTAGNVGFGHAQVGANPTPGPQKAETAAEPKGSVAININPAVGKRYVAADEQGASLPSIPGLPAGERPRMVNSRLFELEYDVDSVGPSGIGRVELWGSRDGGQTWRSYTLDTTRRGPLLVNVEEEGIYGFRAVVSNGAGLGGKSPKSGDLPDLWIGVDLTRPTARIVSAQQGVDDEAGRLIISWQADDKWLAARPVSLSFSETPAGPWLPVASGLENTGRYAWPLDNRTPQKIYLRLEVRDEAGNVGVHQTTEPATIDQSRPSVRIRDVRPVEQTGSRPVRRW